MLNMTNSSNDWRSGNFSDWIVMIGDDQTDYTTHRYVLGLGPRSSSFFYNQFRHSARMSGRPETRLFIGRALTCSCTHRLCKCGPDAISRAQRIDNAVSIAFPLALDYMYTGIISSDADHGDYIALMILCDYLQISGLEAHITRVFSVKGITTDMASAIIKKASNLGVNPLSIIAPCIAVLAREFACGSKSYDMLRCISPCYLKAILEHSAMNDANLDVVACFLGRYCRDSVSDSTISPILKFLDTAAVTTSLLPGDALFFLEHVQFSEYPRLHARCLDSLAMSWPSLPLPKIPFQILIQVLKQNQVAVDNEDQIVNLLLSYVDKVELSSEAQRELWKTVRFPFVSSELLWELRCNESIPNDLIASGAIVANMIKGKTATTALPVSLTGKLYCEPRATPAFSEELATKSIILSDQGRLAKKSGIAAPASAVSRHVVSVPSQNSTYWELKINGPLRSVVGMYIGLCAAGTRLNGSYVGAKSGTWAIDCSTGSKVSYEKRTKYGVVCANGDTIGLLLTANGSMIFFKNGVSMGTAFSGIKGRVAPAVTLNRKDQQVSIKYVSMVPSHVLDVIESVEKSSTAIIA